MRNLYFTLSIIATIGFGASELSAQQQGQEKTTVGDQEIGQQTGKPGARNGGGQGGPSGRQRAGGGPGGMRGGNQNGGGPGGMQRGGGGPNGGGIGARMMQKMPLYIALDTDKDGKLSEVEIRNAVAAIKSLDKNRNGVIDAEEMAPDASQGRGPGGGPGAQGMGRGQGQGAGGQGAGGRRGGGPGGNASGRGGFGGRQSQGGSSSGATKPRRPGSDD